MLRPKKPAAILVPTAVRTIFPPVRDVVKNIPVIAAGGITDGYEMAEMMDKYGADGMQIASRFVLSDECDVADEFKQAYLDAKKEDIVITSSPVGLPGRALRTPFVKALARGVDLTAKKCQAPVPEKMRPPLLH